MKKVGCVPASTLMMADRVVARARHACAALTTLFVLSPTLAQLGPSSCRPPFTGKRAAGLAQSACVASTGSQRRLCRAVESVLSAPCDDLVAQGFLERVVRQLGLVNAEGSDRLFGPDAIHRIRGGGPYDGVFQNPKQYGRALRSIAQHVSPATYLELGVWTGWTASLTSAYLSRFAPPGGAFRGYAVDITNARMANTTQGLLKQLGTSFMPRSRMEHMLDKLHRANRRIDVCLIDAGHSYRSVKRDYEHLARHCSVCVFHDVFDTFNFLNEADGGGVPAFWAQLKANVRDERRIIEIADNGGTFPTVLGFGIVLPNTRGTAEADDMALPRPLHLGAPTRIRLLPAPQRPGEEVTLEEHIVCGMSGDGRAKPCPKTWRHVAGGSGKFD